MQEILYSANGEVLHSGGTVITTGHVLVGMMAVSGKAADVLREAGLTLEAVRDAVRSLKD